MIFDNINLMVYGIPYNGPFNGIKYLSSYWVPELNINDTYEFEGPDGLIYRRKFVVLDKGGSTLGTYGDIEMVLRNGEDVLIRKFSRNGDSLFCEACFQVAAWQILKKFGLEDAISRVTDILKRPVAVNKHQVGFVMEPFLNVDTIGNIFADMGDKVTDTWIASCIAQVALILWILETTLGLNHRDLKGDNILLGVAGKAKKIHVSHEGRTVTVKSLVDVHIVDFGFACNGNGAEGTEVSATNYFPCTDPCPKMGRDIFQLCTFLYMSPKLRPCLGRLTALFEKWLTLPGKDFPAYLRTKNESDTEWIYFLLSSSRFHAEACEPLAVLMDIAAAFPDIVIVRTDTLPPK
jgi:hypothetical protein